MLTDVFYRPSILLAILALFSSTSVPAADRCSQWAPMVSGDVVRDVQWAAGPKCYTIDLPRPGALLLAVSADIETNVAEPRLDVFECRDGAPSSAHVRDRWASSWLGDVSASRYAVCVSAQDPAARLTSFKLASAFVERPLTKSGDPDEDEPEPDDRVAGGNLCRAAATDDHSDLFRCATAVVPGEAFDAEIGNAWGDDEDVFALRLDKLTTVLVIVASTAEIRGTLHDRFGNRLLATTVEDSDGFRLVKTLVPGLYFVRVSAPVGVEGPYRLEVELD